MPDIARLDDDGVLAAVDTVSPPNYRTDPARRMVALTANHDMCGKLGQYRYDFVRGAFVALDGEPLAQAERETAGLVEGLVAAVENIYTHLGVAPHPKAKKALADWRRTVDARRKG